MHITRNGRFAIGGAMLLALLFAVTGVRAVLSASSEAAVGAGGFASQQQQGGQCTTLLSPTEIPASGLIHFDDLPNSTTIGTYYQPTHGVTFEDSSITRALIYGNEPAEAQSPPNVAINDAVPPNTSSGVPMRITFDSPKTHVGMWLGNGETAQIAALITAFDANGGVRCQVRYTPVPEPHTVFRGVYDPLGLISVVEIDYGQSALNESIDDLYFAPFTPGGPTPTPTRTPVPTWTPLPSPTPPPGPTPTPTPPVFAVPIFPIEPVIIPPSLFQPDLSIFGIELTQGIQCFDTTNGLAGCADNSVPLVNKKDSAARIYLKYNSIFAGSLNNVPVRLYIRANGVWYTANVSGKATSTLDQSKTDSAEVYFNVNFTNDVVVDFYAVVDPDNTISETNESNNRYPASGYITHTFRRRGTLDIVGQRLRYHPSGFSGDQYAGGWAVNGGAADFFEQLLPIRNNGINYTIKSGYMDWTKSLTPCSSSTGSDNQHDLIQTLNLRWLMENALSWLFGTGAFTGADHVYGWVSDDGYPCGHADMPVYPHAGGLGVVGIGTDDPGTSTDNPRAGALIFAHELLHDYNLKHTNTGADDCGSNDNSSPFPYSTSSIQEFGFNPFTGKIYDPANTHDVMSYCPANGSKNGWISPYTWNYMSTKLDALSARPVPTEGQVVRLGAGNLQPSGWTQSLVVHASIYNPDHPDYDPAVPGELGDLYQVDTGLTYPLIPGDYAIQLRRGQTILYTETFTVSFQSEYTPGAAAHGGSPEGGDPPPFSPDPVLRADVSLIMPWVGHPNMVVLLHNGTVLAQKAVSLDAPQVTITDPTTAVAWPAGTTQNLQWTASDPNGDPLSYSIMYSNDAGQSWTLLTANLTTTTYPVEVDSLAGGSDVRFRVVATDGVNIGHAETPEAISVPDKAPIVTIIEPPDGRVYEPGELVLLKGSATDMEDGSIPDQGLQWSSDRQGNLGVGPSIPTISLARGYHVITLSVTDSLGQTTTASVTILIGYGVSLPSIIR